MKTMEDESSISDGVYFSPFFFLAFYYTFSSIFTVFLIFLFVALRRNRLGSVV